MTKKTYETFDELKAAVDEGKTVYWRNIGYRVVRGKTWGGCYLIKYIMNGSCDSVFKDAPENTSPNYPIEDFFEILP